MRPLVLALWLFISVVVYGQDCNCDKDTILKDYITCKPKYLDNKSKLYWRFNCDSSWLTFENSKGHRKTIFSLGDGLVSLTTRLGHVSFTEFKTAFIYTNKVISGCCDPDDYYLYDKTSGNLVKYLGRAVYVSEDSGLPIVVSITKSNYRRTSEPDLNTLTIYNLDKRKEYKIPIPKGDIAKGVKNNNFMFPEYVFDTPLVSNGKLTLRYFTQDYRKNKQVNYKTVIIDLKKYSS